MIVLVAGEAGARAGVAVGACFDSTTWDATAAGVGAGTSHDFWRAGDGGRGSGAGAGALIVLVAIGTEVGVGNCVWGPGAVEPLERSTRMRGADLPAKNSAAVREDSTDGAGGNMSAWNESAWVMLYVSLGVGGVVGRAYFSGDDKGDGLDQVGVEFVGTGDLAV